VKPVRTRLCRLAAFALAAALPSAAAHGQRLFHYAEGGIVISAQSAGSTEPASGSFAPFYAVDAVRHGVVVDNLELVRAGAPLLELETPDGRVLRARLSWFEDRGGGNAVWSGRVVGAAYDTVLFTLHDGHLHGSYGAPFEPKFDLRAGGDGLGVVVSGADAGGAADPLHDPWCEEHAAPLPDAPEWVLAAPDPVPSTDGVAISQAAVVAGAAAPPPERVVLGQTAKTITLSVSPASVAENASAAATIAVTATVASADVYATDQTIAVSVGGGTVIDGVATPGTDFAAVPDFTLTLAANATTGTAMFSLDPTDDMTAEPHETVAVSGALAGANVVPAEVWITDDDQHVIDLMTVYTPQVATWMQGLTAIDPSVTIQSETAGLADYVNMVWRNGAFPAQVRLVHVAPVPQGVIDNRGEGRFDYLFAMRTDPDLLRLRDEHDADLVYLWAREATGPRLPCGLAFTRSKVHTTVTMAPSGVGIFNFICEISGEPTSRSILAHEIGHNLGALHEPANHSPDPRLPIYPYAFGHTHIWGGAADLNVATIMSYGTPRVCTATRFGFCVNWASTFTREPFYSTVRLQLTRRSDDDWNANFPLPAPLPLGIAGARENERAIKHLLESTSAFSEYMLAAPPANLTGAATPSGATVDVALTWDDVSSREAGYKVQYRVFGDGAWQEGAALVAGVEAATLTGLAPATRYVFRVAAPNANGLTSYSYEWAVRTPGTGPPNAPGALRAETQGPTLFPEPWDVRLTWSDWSETETGFVVQYRLLGASDWTDGPTVAADASAATVDDLLADEDYEFRVGARNSHGTAWSRVVRQRTDLPDAPDAPSDLAGVRISSAAARLTWTDNSYEDEVGETAFEIHTRPSGGGDWTIASSVAPDTEMAVVAGLPEGARLDFRVASVGPGGSGFSNELSIDLAVEPPGVPVIEGWLDRDRLNDIVTRFSISVDPSNGAEVYVATFRSGQWRRYTPGRVENDHISPYRAEAVNGGGRRVSEQIELGVGRINPRPPPSAPSGLAAASAGPTSVRLTWTDTAADELWYRVSASRSGGPAVVYGVYPANTEEATLVGLQPGRHELFVTLANQHYEITPRTTSFDLPVPDPAPPTAASGLAASFGSTATEVDLSWTDNSTDEDGFRVGVRSDDGTWSFTDAPADATSATVTGLTPNTLYHFRVLAYSADGSFDGNLVTFDLHPQPRAATGLTARAEGSTTAVLEWEDNARNETGYRVEARQGSGPWGTVGSSLPANTTTHTVTGRTASTAYGFRVVAVNGAGEATSAQADVTMPPAAPSNLQAAPAGPTSATLTWTDESSDETGFRAEYRGSGETGWTPWVPDTATGATGVTVSALSPNTNYEFRVLAVHGDNGLSSPSNVATVTNFPRLPEPASDLAATFLGSHSCRVDWKDRSNDETGFMVQYRLFGREEWVDGPSALAGAESATVTGLLANRTYRFRVLAANANGARPSYQIEKTSPPPPPDELTFTVDFPTVNKVFLRWRIEFEDFTHIKIENRIGNHPWFSLGSVGRLSFGRPRTSQSIVDLTPGEHNDFRIRLINANGESSPSNIVSYTTPSGPAAPSGLAASATGSTTVDLSWTDNSDNEGGFDVEYKVSADSAWTVAGSVAADVVTAAARGLVASTAFDFRVTATNAQGSASSDAVSLTMPPPAPTGLVATATSATAAALAWTDNSSDETGFKVQWSRGSAWNNVSTTSADATTSNIAGLQSGQGYEFRVIATNANGDSTPSNVASVGPPLSPPAPTGLMATAAGSTAARLSWTDASTNETAFDVAWRTGGGAWTAASSTAADVTAATVTGLTPGAAYEFQVTARNANGSNATSAVSLTMPPAAPTGLAAAATSASAVNLTWTDASAGESDFLVEYRRAADAAWTAWGTRPAADAVSAAVTGLAAGTVHEFRVFASHQSNGLSSPSNVATTTTFGTRSPTALSAGATDSTNLSFTWRDESTDETGFGVERQVGNGPWAEVLALAPNVEAATLGGFSASTAYGFRVSAKGPSGTSRSDPVSLTMPPPPPTGLGASATSTSAVNLSWTDASDDETSFIVEYRPTSAAEYARMGLPAGAWLRWPTELPAGSDSHVVSNSGLDPRYRLRAGQDYRFQVFAKHSTNGVSSPSNEAEVSMLGAPAAPSGLTVTARGSTQVRLKWKDNSGNDEDNFKVEYRSGAVDWIAGPMVSRNTRSATVKNLSPSRVYEFRVSAVNAHGASPTPGVTLVMPPAAPRIVGVASESASSVNVFWQDLSTDETSFVIEYRKTADQAWTTWGTEAPANARSAVVSGLDAVSYQFRVYAKHRRNGLSTPSETATLDQVGRPAPPTELTATAPRATRVALTWKDNSDDEVAFDVEQRTGDSGAWTSAATVGADTAWATVRNLSAETAYSFRVGARNASGVSWSEPVSVTTLAPAPDPPSGVTATATGSTTALVTWIDNSDDEHLFRVQRRTGAGDKWVEAALANRDETSVEVRRLLPSTTYEIRVLAENPRGGLASPAVSLTMPPAAPTDLSAAAASSTSVTLSWTDASSDAASFVAEYKLKEAASWTAFGTEAASPATSLAVTGLTPGASYEFRVFAKNANGLSSPSNVAAIDVLGGPGAPSAVHVNADGSTEAVVKWTDNSSNETGFTVQVRKPRGDWTAGATAGANTGTDRVRARVRGLLPSTAYEFRVLANNSSGSVESPVVSLTMPPAAPVGLVAATATSTSVNLTWTDASSDETSFVVEYRFVGAKAWTVFGAEPAAGEESVTVGGLQSGVSHEFRVFAKNANGLSSPSGVATTASGAAPAAPSGVTTTPAGSTVVVVSWTDNSSDETEFEVRYRGGSGAWTIGPRPAASVTRATVTGLEPSTAYEFRVLARNASGETASGASSRTTPPAAPGAPSANRTSGTSVALSWTDRSSDETSFVVEYKALNAAAWTTHAPETVAGAASLTVSGLDAATNYAFRVFAKHSANGLSTPSQVVSVGPFGAPAAPTNLAAAMAARSASLTWRDNASDETGFRVEYRLARAGAPWTLFTMAAADASMASVTGLAASTAHEFRVGAANAAGVSWSPVVSGTTAAGTAPAAPRNLSFTKQGLTTLKLTWEDRASNETAYVVSYEHENLWEIVYAVYPANAETATVTGLVAETYQFYVRAKNEVGESSKLRRQFTLPRQNPKPPKKVANLKAELTGPYTVKLTWKDRADDETDYYAAIREDEGFWEYARSAPDSTSGFFHGLKPNTQYWVRVLATHAENGALDYYPGIGTSADGANWVGFDTFREPRAPSELTVTPTGSTSATVTWVDESAEETGFAVQLRGEKADWVTRAEPAADSETANLSGLAPSAPYQFRVRTLKGKEAADSEAVALTMPPPPPTGLEASRASATSAELTWTDESKDETSFVAEYRTVADPPASWRRFADEADTDETSLTVTGLTSGANVEFRVFAKHEINGRSSPSEVAALDQVGAPRAPSNLSVRASGSTSVEVTWIDKSSNETGFRVERRPVNGVWAADATLAANAATATVTGLSASTTYEVRVLAVNAHGSTSSAVVRLTMPPAAPTGLLAAEASATSADLSWTDASSDETAFVAQYRTTGATAWTTFGTEAAAGATSITVTGLTAGESYYFRVLAKHGVNGLSSPSNVVSVGEIGAPDPPLGVAVLATDSTTVVVTWTDASDNETGFRVEYRATGASAWASGATADAGADGARVTGLTPSTAYDFRVLSLTTAVSAESSVASLTMPPAAPTDLTVLEKDAASVTLTWTDNSSDETGFGVYYRKASVERWGYWGARLGEGATSVTVGALEPGTAYQFRVHAEHETNGLSSPSNIALATTEGESLTVSGLSDASVAENEVWTSPAPFASGHAGAVTWTKSGADAADFTIDGGTGVLTMVARDHEAPADADADNVYEVTVTAADAENAVGSVSIGVTVTDVNEAPSFASSATLELSVAEGTSGDIGPPVVATDPEGAALVYTLGGADASAFEIGSTGQLSVASGTVLDHETKAAYSFNVVATEPGTNPLTATRAVELAVTDVDESLAISGLANASVEENSPWTSPTPSTTGHAGAVTWTKTGADAAAFTIDGGTGVLTMVACDHEDPADADRNNVYEVTVTATDAEGNSGSVSITVTVTNVNEAPSFASAMTLELSVAEGTSGDIGPPVVATDPEGAALVYTLGGADASAFEIGSTGQLSVASGTVLDHETKAAYSFNVVATEPGTNPLTATRAVELAVTDVDESLTVSGLSDASVAENTVWTSPAPSATGHAGAVTWSKSGADAAAFAIDGATGALTMDARDHEAPADADADNFYEVTVTATDAENAVGAVSIAVTVTNVNEAPVFASSATLELSVPEGTTGAIGSVAATDPEGASLVYSLDGADAAAFAVSSAGQISLAPGAVLDYEQKSSYGFDVVVSDGETPPLTATRAVALAVTNVNEAPTFASSATLALSVPEGTAGAFASVSATDLDGATLVYSLNGTDAAAFAVSSAGRISTAPDTVLDHGQKSSYGFNVVALDAGTPPLTATRAVTLAVTAVPIGAPAPATWVAALATDSTTVVVTWRDASDNETGFRVEYRTTGTTAWQSGATADPGADGARVTGLAPSTAYDFRVLAVNAHGSIGNAVMSLTMPPAAPTDLEVLEVDATSMTLAWTDNSSDETGFGVYARKASAERWGYWTGGVSEIGPSRWSMTVSALEPGTTYEFRVHAKHATNGLSSPSNVVSATTDAE